MKKNPHKPSTRARVIEAAEELRKALRAHQRRVRAEAPGLLQKAEVLRKAIRDHQGEEAEQGPRGELFKLLNRHMRSGKAR